MEKENGNFISPEKLEQTRKTASYKKDCCKKNTRINIRVTKRQNEEISRLAAESGLTKSRYILNRAFERPQLSVEAGRIITNIDENRKELRNQKNAFIKNCKDTNTVNIQLLNGLMDEVELLCLRFDWLKEELYKSYLSAIERANYEQRKKRREQREKQKQRQKEG